MNIGIYNCHFLKPLMVSLEKDGHKIIYNRFSVNLDLIISESYLSMYKIFKILKKIQKYKIKFINIIFDIPPWRLLRTYKENSIFCCLQQFLYHFSHRNQVLRKLIHERILNEKIFPTKNMILRLINHFFNICHRNQRFYQIDYRKYLNYSDLNLSISRFTQYSVKKFLKVDSKVWYPSVNSEILLNLPKPSKIKYDAINISRIVETKHQALFVEAAKKLKLNVIIIGRHQDKKINLGCPQFYITDHYSVLNELNHTGFYVDASIFEGFGMTPVEAAFLDKTTIASNTFIHREILGDYPLYFKADDVDDLVEKMKLVIDNGFSPNKEAIKRIKKLYSIEAAKKRFLDCIESILKK